MTSRNTWPLYLIQLSLPLLSAYTAVTAQQTPQNSGGAVQPGRTPNIFGSGVNFHFPGIPATSYCLVTDPCIHVNALLAAPSDKPSDTWVKGYGFRIGQHTLTLKVIPPYHRPNFLFSLNGKALSVKEATGCILRSNDGDLSVSAWDAKEGSFLLTAKRCNMRILILVKKGWISVHPHLSIEILDWYRLNAPHGILGQMFTNHAGSELFSPGDSKAIACSSPREQVDRSILGVTAVADNSADSPDSFTKDTSTALSELYKLQLVATPLDGLPQDYATSDLLTTDCTFSRFACKTR